MRGFFGLTALVLACGSDKFSSGDGGGADGPIMSLGCADGTREAFLDSSRFPAIAACSGAFTVPGTASAGSAMTQCGRTAGNTGTNMMGMGCTIEDLCANGWHVCRSAQDVLGSLPMGTTSCATVDQTGPGFWATRQTTNMSYQCLNTQGSTNNVVGCAFPPVAKVADMSCAPLTHTMSFVECAAVGAWQCNAMQPDAEALTIAKPGVAGGGVMCCSGL